MVKITREEKHVFAENVYFEHAQNNEIIQMASGHAHDTICDVFPSPVCSGAYPTKSKLSTEISDRQNLVQRIFTS